MGLEDLSHSFEMTVTLLTFTAKAAHTKNLCVLSDLCGKFMLC